MLATLRHAFSLLVIVAAVLLGPAGPGPAAAAPGHVATSPDILYISGGHLYLQPVDSGTARLIPTPWKMINLSDSSQEVQRSPDGRRVALGDDKNRLAVVNMATGHITWLVARACRANCNYSTTAWSPNGRYLAILEPTGNGYFGTLSVWDSSMGTTHRLTTGVATSFGGLDWSHDSTRLVVGTGKLDMARSVFPSATVVDLQGHTRVLGPGSSYGWSPDDRFIGIVRSHFCGANTCDDAELVRPAAGGPATTLIQHIPSTFESPGWAPQPGGYAFDRWLLGPAGHLARRLAGPHERVDSWEPDGSHLAVESYHPYYQTPDALYISTPQGQRVHLYTAGAKDDCGACSKDIYQVTWSQHGKLVAFITPTYPTPEMVIVYPKLFLSGIDGGALTRIRVPTSDNPIILGFADEDRELVIFAGHTIYRYTIGTGSLSDIASNVFMPAFPGLYPGGA